MATTSSAPTEPGRRTPVLGVTRYDLVTSALIAGVAGLVLTVLWLTAVWITNRLAEPEHTPALELLELPGGFEDGTVDETLELVSPEEEIADPSLADMPAEETEIEQTLESVVELADEATNQADQVFELETRNVGKAGSASGTGRRALGLGPGESGLPRDQRWFVRFADRGTLRTYAEQLEQFGIQLGALIDGKKIVYLSNLTAERPKTRTVTSGAGENRLYMTWQGGSRRQADLEFFKRAGVDVGNGTIMHFYPPETEAMLARLERSYRNRAPDEIRRTYFLVQRSKRDRRRHEFIVTHQVYFE